MNFKKKGEKKGIWYAGGVVNTVTPQESELLIQTDHSSGQSSSGAEKKKPIHPFIECNYVKDNNLKMQIRFQCLATLSTSYS